jgi:hypothetical protein
MTQIKLVHLVTYERVENISSSRRGYKTKVVASAKKKLEAMLSDLMKEFSSGVILNDFKVRIDQVYQDIMCKYIIVRVIRYLY